MTKPPPQRKRPTPEQMELLKAIASSVERNGFQPSLADLAALLKVEVAAVMELLAGLRAKGVVEIVGDRAVRIVGMLFTASPAEPQKEPHKESPQPS